ncbi:hypothetical protein DPMN_041680 [Dreissena polymorpha]|uniref:Uncharacterized protein n=1 Tax=Dreissena polymorpha TaxID=45954 RepID=A0A9D4HWF2_DREPO|nr:hypothetical protein DPMN_041680 [Dreissena polymorpha]
MQKLEKVLSEAYSKAKVAALRSRQKCKKYYDRKVRECKLLPGDRVLVRNVGLKGKHKLGYIWKEIP